MDQYSYGRRSGRTVALAVGAGVLAFAVMGGIAVWAIDPFGHPAPAALLRGAPAAATSAPARTPSATASPTPVPGSGCSWQPVPAAPGRKDVGTPPATPAWSGGTVTMTLATNLGTITVAMDPGRTPCTVSSFAYLAGRHFFDNSGCHRLVRQPGFSVLQCGDPSGTGQGGPAYQFADENLAAAQSGYPRGTVAMANSGPDTNGSQFFFVFADTKLPADYTPFGTVTGGMDIIQNIGDGGDDGAFGSQAGGGHPNRKLTFQSVTVGR